MTAPMLGRTVRGLTVLAVAVAVAGCSGPDAPALKDVPVAKANPPKDLPPTKKGDAMKKGQPPFGSSAVTGGGTKK
jgi:hypothetical protein